MGAICVCPQNVEVCRNVVVLYKEYIVQFVGRKIILRTEFIREIGLHPKMTHYFVFVVYSWNTVLSCSF